jgi:hypothetical protein
MALVAMAELLTPRSPLHGANRPEALECPPRLDADLAAENPGRVMEACVDARELEALGVRHGVAAATGRPSEPPGARRTRYRDGDRYR